MAPTLIPGTIKSEACQVVLAVPLSKRGKQHVKNKTAILRIILIQCLICLFTSNNKLVKYAQAPDQSPATEPCACSFDSFERPERKEEAPRTFFWNCSR